MAKTASALFILLTLFFCPGPAAAAPPFISGPDVRIIDNNILVDLSVSNTAQWEETIRSGMGKEIIYTVELIRSWRFWPDEFVVSKKISKTIRYDNLRDHYLTSSEDGVSRTEKKFKDFASLRQWLFTVHDVNLANIKELQRSDYYIRTVVRSKSVEQLPLISFLVHLIPEVEMTLARESPRFALGMIP